MHGRAIATFFNFYVSLDSTVRFSRGGKNIIIVTRAGKT